MSVPEGTPKHIRMADEMAQALVTSGAILALMKNYHPSIITKLEKIKEQLIVLDRVADELRNGFCDRKHVDEVNF